VKKILQKTQQINKLLAFLSIIGLFAFLLKNIIALCSSCDRRTYTA